MAAAELSTPSAAEMATAGEHTPTTSAGKDKQAPTPAVTGSSRPERPDEEAYKEELAKAEKELRAAEERLVCAMPLPTLRLEESRCAKRTVLLWRAAPPSTTLTYPVPHCSFSTDTPHPESNQIPPRPRPSSQRQRDSHFPTPSSSSLRTRLHPRPATRQQDLPRQRPRENQTSR